MSIDRTCYNKQYKHELKIHSKKPAFAVSQGDKPFKHEIKAAAKILGQPLPDEAWHRISLV